MKLFHKFFIPFLLAALMPARVFDEEHAPAQIKRAGAKQHCQNDPRPADIGHERECLLWDL